MKLTAEQWFEITMALQHGLSKASWEGFGTKAWSTLNDAERAAILDTVRQKETALARSNAPASGILSLNQQYLDRMTLAATKAEDAQEQQQRDAFYALPPETRARSVRTCKADVNELLAGGQLLSLRQRRAVEHRLAARSLPSLDTLLRNHDRKVAALLKRGVIKNDDEYYLAQEVLADLEFDISGAQRERLDHMAASYHSPSSGQSRPA